MSVVDLFHNGIKETAGTRSLGKLCLYYASCLLGSRELLLRLLLYKLLLSLRKLLSWIKLLLLWRKLLLLLKGLLLKLLLLLGLKLLLGKGLLLLRKVLEARLLLTKTLLLLLLGVEDLRERGRRLLLGGHLQSLTSSTQTRAITCTDVSENQNI